MSTCHSPSDYWGRDPNQGVWKPVYRRETLYLGLWNCGLLLAKPKGPFGIDMKIADKAEFFFYGISWFLAVASCY